MYIQCSLSAQTGHTTCSKSILHDQCNSGQLRAHSKHTQSTLRTHSEYRVFAETNRSVFLLVFCWSAYQLRGDLSRFYRFVRFIVCAIFYTFHPQQLPRYWKAFCRNARVVFIIMNSLNCKSAQPRPLTQPG